MTDKCASQPRNTTLDCEAAKSSIDARVQIAQSEVDEYDKQLVSDVNESINGLTKIADGLAKSSLPKRAPILSEGNKFSFIGGDTIGQYHAHPYHWSLTHLSPHVLQISRVSCAR